jgi:predicted unusual protein kinase regulating ubiquinone biosynthesis (AarF/ABC1/UbiB family)
MNLFRQIFGDIGESGFHLFSTNRYKILGTGVMRTPGKELKEYTDELYTATTRESIANAIIEGFSDGKRSAKDFADDFEGMMKDALLQSIKINALQEPLKAWYETFSPMPPTV